MARRPSSPRGSGVGTRVSAKYRVDREVRSGFREDDPETKASSVFRPRKVTTDDGCRIGYCPTGRTVDNPLDEVYTTTYNVMRASVPNRGSGSRGPALIEATSGGRSQQVRTDPAGTAPPTSDGQQAVASDSGVPDALSAIPEPMRARLIATGASLFQQKGFDGATTRELAGLLGLKKASLYHYVQNKQDLLYAICLASIESISSEVSEAIEKAPPEERLRHAIRAHIEAAVRDQDMHAVMLVELRSLDPELQSKVKDLRSGYEQQIRNLLREEQEAGRIQRDVDSKYLLLMLLNLLNWTIFWYKSTGPLQARQFADLLTELFLNGAKAPSGGDASPLDGQKGP
jgi:AcrR family transcriptional regulator